MDLRFALHEHSGYGPLHYDLMLEQSGALATWQFGQDPRATGEAGVPCRRIQDHRKAYLDYEGPVSRGRGQVRILDRGRLTVLRQAAEDADGELARQAVAGVGLGMTIPTVAAHLWADREARYAHRFEDPADAVRQVRRAVKREVARRRATEVPSV
ncbi:MAG: DNA polymerase ligase N-terminal domain-containing protein [Planctomycetota bacterium]